MNRRQLLAAALLFAACPKAKKPKKVKVEEAPTEPKAQLRKFVKDLYADLDGLEAEKFEKYFTDDVAAYGLGPNDFFTGPAQILEELRREFIPLGIRGDKLEVHASAPRIGLAEGEQSAWLFDWPRFERVRDNGKSQYWAPRITAHLIRDFDSWKIDALHVSMPYPDESLNAPGSEKKLAPPIDPGNIKGPDSDQLVGLTKRLLDDIGVKVDRTSDLSSVALVGTAPTDLFQGGKKFKALVKPQLAAIKKANVYTYKIDSGPRAKLAPGGKSGWVMCTVQLSVAQGRNQPPRKLTPFRALFIYTEENGLWNLVSDHQSLGLKMELREPVTKDDLAPLEPDDDPVPPKKGEKGDKPDAGAAPAKPDAGTPSKKKEKDVMEAW